MSSSFPDAYYIQRVLDGEASAFEPLVLRYQQAIYAYLSRLLNNPDMALELTQNTLVEAYQHLGRFHVQRSFKSWLLGIAHNQVRTFWRQTQRQQQRLSSLDDVAVNESLAFATYDPPADNDPNGLWALLDKLDPRYKQALILRFQQDLSYQDVAQAMNVPINTVRTWLKRGKAQLLDLALKNGYGKDQV